MEFRTEIHISGEENPKIDYTSEIFGLGSCFVENIGGKLDFFKFSNTINPYGIIYNPISIERLVKRMISKDYFTENDIFYFNDQWQSFHLHSKLNTNSKEDFLKIINSELDKSCQRLKSATHLILTLGTSWIYQLKETGEVVANCHKVPQKDFNKLLLNMEDIEFAIDNLNSYLSEINPLLKVICTVSPVRHLKDGFVENMRSKAHLITAISRTVELYDNWYYFPSFEIMMDDLRDYRFYKNDLLHPNDLAVDYIWEKFSNVWIDDKAKPIMKRVANIQKGLAHKPFNVNSERHLDFLRKLNLEIRDLKHIYPSMNFDN